MELSNEQQSYFYTFIVNSDNSLGIGWLVLLGITMIVTLHNPQQGHAVLKDLWPKIKETLQAGKQLRLEVKKANRSNEQNDMFHALIDKVTKEMKVAGSDWDAECWKRLLIDAWATETGRKIGRVVPSLDGQRVVQLGVQSHKFTVEEGSEFIEWLLCWMANKGIEA